MAKLLTIPRALALGGVLLIALIGSTLPSAQTRPGPAAASTPADQALRALNVGQFEEVERLLRGATDARSVAIRARADIARGRYADAEKLLAPVAAAQPASDAALELGLLQMRLGRRADARRTLNRLLDGANPDSGTADLVRLGIAARALGEFQEANGFFRDANRLSPDDPAVNTAWGELFLEKYNTADALKSFQAALGADEDNVAARIGLARVALDQNPPAAKSAVERALKTNPKYVPAHLLNAEIALDERRRDDARESIRQALEVNPQSFEARALRGAMAFLEGRTADFEREVQELLALNPVYGEAYRLAGDHLARNYRFDEAAQLTRQALKVDPENTRAYADLGLHLLRTGDEPAARVALERAFKDDPYDTITYNLLQMMDKLDKFETVTDREIVMRFDPSEAAVMKEHALPLAREAIDTLAKRYEIEIKGPILIEMFPVHDDFAVRNLGLPGMIGALGACFGRVVTLDSPRARPPGEFNWGSTLWHEIAHVVTLQLSNNRVPRWLTEGISVWEEKRARPEWGREMEVAFAQALDQGKAIKLDVLNEAFSDPQLISLAYYQGSLLVEHLVDTYGEPKLRDLLRAYGRGLETPEALKAAYGVAIPELQAAFDARMEKQYAAARLALKRPETSETATVDELKKLAAEHPSSFGVHMQLGLALRKAGDPAAAIKALERASELLPYATGENNPNVLIAAIATEQGDTARAVRAYEAVMRVDHSDIESARKLAGLVAKIGDNARAEDAYRRVVAIDPFETQAQTSLGRIALQRKDTGTAVRAFRSALATNPPDRAAAHLDLAEAYMLAGNVGDAKKETLAALEIAPSFERAQDLLLRIVDASGGGA